MLTPKKRAQLDNLLGRDLGRNKFGEPNYKWQFSERFFHNMVIAGKRNWNEKPLFDDAGQPVLEPPTFGTFGEMIPGKQKCIITLSRETQVRKMCPQLNQQWLLSIWSWTPEPVWRAKFGTDLEWPARGMYFAVDGSALHPGLEPTVDITQAFIDHMRWQREQTMQQLIEESERAIDLEEKHAGDRIYDIIDDATTAFGHANPGSRAGGVSVPTAEFTKNYERFMETNDIIPAV